MVKSLKHYFLYFLLFKSLSEEEERFVAALEYHAGLENNFDESKWVCQEGELKKSMNGTLEIAYNHFANRLKL
jgi:hypothetical protein